ncbi:MAG: DUF805 domain-containing protein [Rhizomicrobium sp.]|jgi:uncharacterized membrane protein YhaH (DUF805 family)
MDQVDFNKLWQNFVDTVTNHYMDFNGRVGRAQFWWYVLVGVVLGIGVSIVASIVTHLLSTLFALALLLPNLGMTVRRLHDTGKPGIWALLLLVPLVVQIFLGLMMLSMGMWGVFGFLYAFIQLISLASLVALIIVIYFCAQPGDASANAYGPPPAPWTSGGAAKTPPAT